MLPCMFANQLQVMLFCVSLVKFLYIFFGTKCFYNMWDDWSIYQMTGIVAPVRHFSISGAAVRSPQSGNVLISKP